MGGCRCQENIYMNVEIPSNIETILVSVLEPYARNTRTHSEEQVEKIAKSIEEFGFTNPVLIDDSNGIIAGHGRTMAAKLLGLESVPCIRLSHLTDEQRRAYVIADNKLADDAGWDEELLALELGELNGAGYDLSLTGFEESELAELVITEIEESSGLTDDDAVPDSQTIDVISRRGDIWELGDHRVMCGDSCDDDDVRDLMNGETALLIHADPPYGMGKQSDGVLNDNLYKEKLDDFQMLWWNAFRQYTAANGSAYIWGNAPDLWRFWYTRLQNTETIELRNHITWDKKSIAGMKSGLMTQFPVATEHCLFMQLGKQFIGNINADDFPEEWVPLLDYLSGEAEAVGLTSKVLRELCGVQMFSHWFTRSQFSLISEKHYVVLQETYDGNFKRSWADLKSEWDKLKGRGRDVINGQLAEGRSYFDNTHEVMRDVWEFPRVVGEERHNHATPKPVAMMVRVMKSSLPPKGLCIEPFGGSGSTLMGAEKSGRRCFTMELQELYVDIIVRRWQEYTGKKAIHSASGKNYDEVRNERAA